jgi:DNA topoisomerase-3
MGKRLIIAEKPSVAGDIARVLGGFKKYVDYYESDEAVISSAVGHLLEISAGEYEVKRGKWSIENLPVIPPHFALKPIEKTEARLKLLTKLIKRKDVDRLINACDAGREGELIFRYIARHTKTHKPIERLWLQSMTPTSIRTGFEHLRSDGELLPLADAATCRSESDWLVGINGTRAMTAFNSKSGGFHKTPVGRVQTPTLAILVEREEKIKRFIPRDYWEVHATFGVAAGEYDGRWFDESYSKKKDEEDADLRAERLWDEKRAIAIRTRCEGQPGVISEESKPSTQLSPQLFDLTSLQRAANGRFGFSARTTLSIAQALYERHKALTYPRTDARALPEDYIETVKETLQALSGGAKSLEHRYASYATKILEQKWVRPNKRIFNNAKVSDHFAIIPTGVIPKTLSDAEAKLYDFVVRRFLAVFYPPAEYLVTTRITRVAGEPFRSDGKVLKQAGWLEVHGKEVLEDDEATLVPVAAGEDADTLSLNVMAMRTKPPARYTEATLLSAMEGAGKLVEDEELREAMKERGLGTPATRAGMIEKLILEEYVIRNQRELQPTPKAFSLFTLLRGLKIPELTSPELTGEWEHRLREMEQGRLSREKFMQDIADMTKQIVERVKVHESDTVPGEYTTLSAACPNCGGLIKENYKKYQCQSCDFSVWRILSGRQFEPAEIEALIAKREIGPLQGFRSRLGKPFAANIKLTPDFKLEFDFGQQSEGDGEPIDFSLQQPLGPCPKCANRVYSHGMAYVCEKAVGSERSCDFRSGKVILQRSIEPEQMTKLLTEGKTDLLHRFISKKGRPFSAFLVKGADGKVGFEFAPRVAKTPAPSIVKATDKPKAAPRARKAAS